MNMGLLTNKERVNIVETYGVFFSTKECALYLKKKMEFCVCFLEMFHPLKGFALSDGGGQCILCPV